MTDNDRPVSAEALAALIARFFEDVGRLPSYDLMGAPCVRVADLSLLAEKHIDAAGVSVPAEPGAGDLWAIVDGEASPALERASFDEVAEALVWAILDGTFQTEEAARHAVTELAWKASQPVLAPEASDVGIYPASSPEGPRTPWQEGWNAAVIAMADAAPEASARRYAALLLDALDANDAANIHGWSVALRAALAATPQDPATPEKP